MVERCGSCGKQPIEFVCWECYDGNYTDLQEQIDALEKAIEALQRANLAGS